MATAVLGLASSAHAATTTHPAGGSTFASDQEGWVGSGETCSIPLFCSAQTFRDTTGDPDGAIATDVQLAVGALGLFEGSADWTSPAFAVPAGVSVTGATISFDRSFSVDAALDLGSTTISDVVVTLIDETAGGTSTELVAETLDEADSAYATTTAPAPAGAVVAGHTYRLQVQTATSGQLLTLGAGSLTTRYDNVGLTVTTADAPDAPGGPGGPGSPAPPDGSGGLVGAGSSPGVRGLRSALSGAAVGELIGSLGIGADVGNGPGGSLVPASRCTIVGTAGNDRIVGTGGNDVICARGGNDVVIGGGGRDVVDGGNGADRLRGGVAGDLLLGLRGNDRLDGGAGPDRLGGGAGRDRLAGGRGNDRLNGRRGSDRMLGGAGKDRLGARDRRRDYVDGGRGRDTARVDRAARGAKRARSLKRADRVRRVERVR